MDTLLFALMSLITFGCSIGSFLKIIMVYKKYKGVENKNNISGCEVSQKILNHYELDHTYVVEIKGFFNNYDPNRNVIRLSHDTFHNCTIISMILSAQQSALVVIGKKKSSLLKIREMLSQTIDIITYLSYIGLVLALCSTSFQYLKLAISVMFVITLFYLVTLKLDYMVANRANLELKKLQLIKKSEIDCAKEISNSFVYLKLASIILLPINLINKLIKESS